MQKVLEIAEYDAPSCQAVLQLLQEENLGDFYDDLLSRLHFMGAEEIQLHKMMPEHIMQLSEAELDAEIAECTTALRERSGYRAKFEQLQLLQNLNGDVNEIAQVQVLPRTSEEARLGFDRRFQEFSQSCAGISATLALIREHFSEARNQAVLQPEFMLALENVISQLESALQGSCCDEIMRTTEHQQSRLFAELSRLRCCVQRISIENAELKALTAVYEARQLCSVEVSQYDAEALEAQNQQLHSAYHKAIEQLKAHETKIAQPDLDAAEIELYKDQVAALETIYSARKAQNSHYKHLQAQIDNNAEKLRHEYESTSNLNILCQLQMQKIAKYFEQIQTVVQNIIKMKSQVAAQQQQPLELLALNRFFEELGSDGTVQGACDSVEALMPQNEDICCLRSKALEIAHCVKKLSADASKMLLKDENDCIYEGYADFGALCKKLGV